MQILHISDLHVTNPGETLETVWNGPSAVLSDKRFDFIVVSGDLSQRASEQEYRDLGDFAREHLLRLLTHDKQHERIVFVPGNHDVDWAAPVGKELRFQDYIAQESTPDPKRFLAELLRSPDRAGARHVVHPDGSVGVVKIDAELYQDRFKNVQRFFDDFYGKSLHGPNHHRFDLTMRDDAQHWSAHLFPEQNIAFYGFNSCHHNDRYWHGASISRLAINRAARHAREFAKDMLRVAVWHHGLAGEPGRPDHLTLLDIGELHNAGFRVGFHGHTHEAAGEILDKFFGDRFVVVSTGSLGASSDERPDAVGRQLSLVQLFPGQATVEVWERRNVGVFRAAGDPRFYLLPQGATRSQRVSRASLHRRKITVHDNGIAEVEVELCDLKVEGRPTLAVVSRPLGNVIADEHAETERGLWPVIRDGLPDGRVRFTLAANDSATKRLIWRYRVSNAHALHRDELRLMPRDGRSKPDGVADDEECRWHEVNFPTDRLELTIRYDPSLPGLEPSSVQRVVDHRRSDGGNEWWERVKDEEHDRRYKLVASGTHAIEASVDAPLVGHRYTAAYKLAARAEGGLSDEALLIARTVLERTRRERSGGDGFSRRLSRMLDKCLAEVFTDTPSAGLSVVGFLWHPEERHLLAAYGRLNHSHWGARFSLGAGVAGHAFRFASTATWHRRNASEISLIYRPSSEARAIYGTEYPHQWIVSVPILTETGAAIGVVSLGSREAESNTEFTLARYAERAGVEAGSDPQLESNLRMAVNYAFWETLADPTIVGEEKPPSEVMLPTLLRGYAKHTVHWLDKITVESNASEPPVDG